MALGIMKPKPKEEPKNDDEEYSEEDVETYKKLLGGGKKDNMEWQSVPEGWDSAQKSGLVTKDYDLSNLDHFEIESMERLSEILQYVKSVFPTEKKLVRSIFDYMMAELKIRGSKDGWARRLTVTQRAELEKNIPEGVKKEKKVV